MANEHKQSLRFLLVLVIVLFKGVTSNIDNEDFKENSYGGFNEGFYNPFNDRFPESYDAPLHPIENHLWRSPENLGEISGVAVDPSGKLVIFHRADRVWDYYTFDENAEYQEKYRGPIRENVVLTLNPNTGDVIRAWGNLTFYLPHGVHVDSFGNVWLTDIALHQVFKYSAHGVPRLVLGQRFEPGSDLEHFCQPTSVAVAPGGEIVVADGYCNSRIMLFDSRGNPKYSIGEHWVSLKIPHALTILPDRQVCVADRENSRIVCMNVGLSGTKQYLELPYSIRHRQFDRIYGIASYHGIIYAVNGVTSRSKLQGFTIEPINRSVIGFWGPESSPFLKPHAIAICPNGTALYVSEIGPNRVWKFDLVQTQ
ncbi:peptidyl-alpha-hydroxyglycine alpha-amidating lyase 2 [Harpegnathos saltator]|uniref:peptidylamidoglycolate lyase n=1 Tax=Harpegnathos saltator TaxID=610380 RepID=E2B5I5_HARSA|nr:peptidyl-alpha-hydroxyglycine alpha-amidating lyase 2 [Harpegnathos saltator]XP_011146849.1 peptidyl-alpha-hydroxyglycine alpha-amidating lyase 2 [Harpegnathos saltator]EFN89071.1 Peptidyl-alpha-hydroxyglycine alpha-amidating lyase 2 [Harpegnathos saltator]